ncbi:hypothetical protein Goari_018155 [Gossypium aridum]|uniref:Uncharacterized protein n=1 Tax=Gossypium aridum TaxID=34290 RepID=A0A7J8WNR8_GOSAI|nr:hypothetical protein [Gossypium aridum]
MITIGADNRLVGDVDTTRIIEETSWESISLSKEIDEYIKVRSFIQNVRGYPSSASAREGSASSLRKQKKLLLEMPIYVKKLSLKKLILSLQVALVEVGMFNVGLTEETMKAMSEQHKLAVVNLEKNHEEALEKYKEFVEKWKNFSRLYFVDTPAETSATPTTGCEGNANKEVEEEEKEFTYPNDTSLFNIYGEGHCKVISIALRALWFARNLLVNENANQTAHEVITFVEAYSRELDELNSRVAPCTVREIGHWEAAVEPFVKINFDAGFYPCTAEALADLQALHFADGMGEKNIVVYSLTKEAFKHRTCLYWIEEVPDAIIPLVDGDRRWADPG